MSKRRKARRGDTRLATGRTQGVSSSSSEGSPPARRPWWLIGSTALVLVVVLVLGLVVLAAPGEDSASGTVSTAGDAADRPAQQTRSERPATAEGPASALDGLAVGTAVGDRPPDFAIVGTNGRSITRDALLGSPALLWFTTSYCLPCAEGALRLQTVLDRIGEPADELQVVIVFVDGGETEAALDDWQRKYGRPEWTMAFSAGSMVRDFRLAYLDTKYLIDRDGVIQVADFVPLQTDPWERDIRAVLADSA